MAYISHEKLWRPEFYNYVSANESVQDISLANLILKVNVTFKKSEKIKTNFEPSKYEDVHKAHLDATLSEVNGHITFFLKNYIENKDPERSNKQSEVVPNEKAVKSNKQTLDDR